MRQKVALMHGLRISMYFFYEVRLHDPENSNINGFIGTRTRGGLPIEAACRAHPFRCEVIWTRPISW